MEIYSYRELKSILGWPYSPHRSNVSVGGQAAGKNANGKAIHMPG